MARLLFPTPPEPEGLDDGSVEALLDAAEDILNDVAPSVMQELAEEARAQ